MLGLQFTGIGFPSAVDALVTNVWGSYMVAYPLNGSVMYRKDNYGFHGCLEDLILTSNRELTYMIERPAKSKTIYILKSVHGE